MEFYKLGEECLKKHNLAEAVAYFQKSLSLKEEDELRTLEIILETQVKLSDPFTYKTFYQLVELQLMKLHFKEAHAYLFDKTKTELINSHKKNRWYELAYEWALKNGEREECQRIKLDHLQYLTERKLFHHLKIKAQAYYAGDPFLLPIHLYEMEALIKLDDHTTIRERVTNLIELIHRHKVKIQNKKINFHEVVEVMNSLFQDNENAHKNFLWAKNIVHLFFNTFRHDDLKKVEYKKIIELVIIGKDAKELSLVFQLVYKKLNVDQNRIFFENLKKISGYSYVQLTKYDPALRTLIGQTFLGFNRPGDILIENEKREIVDFSLEKVEGPIADESIFNHDEDKSHEYLDYQMDVISQFKFNPPPKESILDLLFTFQQLNFQRVVKVLIDMHMGQSEDVVVRKKVSYFAITWHLQREEFFMALNICNDLRGETSLSLEELKELYYVEASIYQSLGMKKEAIKGLKQVSTIDPDYRQTRERLLRFEKI